jgi:hypothetical protein
MKTLILSLSILLFATSCKKEETTLPIVVNTTVSYKVEDTMRLSNFYLQNLPTFYANYANKTYGNTETNMVTNYMISNQDVILEFTDSSNIKGNTLIIKFANKSLATIAGNYSLANTNSVSYQQSQKFYNGNIANGLTYANTTKGNIEINFDQVSNTLSGSISNFTVDFGVYVPYLYPNSSVIQTFSQTASLSTDYSTRTFTISFKNLKAK